VSDFPDREGQYAQREELSRAWAIVDNQTAEIEELEKRHAALVVAVIRLHDSLSPDETRGVLWRNVEDALYPRGTSDG
jgi:hypothetical protein